MRKLEKFVRSSELWYFWNIHTREIFTKARILKFCTLRCKNCREQKCHLIDVNVGGVFSFVVDTAAIKKLLFCPWQRTSSFYLNILFNAARIRKHQIGLCKFFHPVPSNFRMENCRSRVEKLMNKAGLKRVINVDAKNYIKKLSNGHFWPKIKYF